MAHSSWECREFAFGSETYRDSLILREEILRKPLGLSWEPGALDGEEHSFHLGCFDSSGLVGTLILKPLDAVTVKMRQVAVAPRVQGQGVGSALVRFAEEFARAQGFTRMVAHARDTAVRFYQALGYQVEGEPFLEVSIPHRAISKLLQP